MQYAYTEVGTTYQKTIYTTRKTTKQEQHITIIQTTTKTKQTRSTINSGGVKI